MSLYLQYVFRIGNINTLGLDYFAFLTFFPSVTYFLSITPPQKKKKNPRF